MEEVTAQVKKMGRPLPKSRVMANELIASVYARGFAAQAAGQPVGWSTAIFPQELCEVFDIPVLYPENNCAGISAKHDSDRFIQHAEGTLGYSNDICSYARLNLGMASILNRDPEYTRPDPAMPRPTFLLCATNSCFQLLKWYECLSREFQIPIFTQDCLYNYYEEPPAPHKVRYFRSQLEHNIRRMEEFFGRRFDWNKFEDIQRVSAENSRLFDEIVSINTRDPAPMNGFDLFNYMAPMVVCRGKRETTEILKQLKLELEENIQKGISTFGPAPEEYRVDWEGIACWPNLGSNLKTMKKYGINCVTNGYVGAWNIAYEPGDLDAMSRCYMQTSTNVNSTFTTMDKRASSARHFGCDGMLCHVNRSCKFMSFHMFVGRELVEEWAGIPVATFDGDQSDPTIFNEAQFETRVQSLVDIMKLRKEAGTHV